MKKEEYCLRCGRSKEHIRAEKDKMCSSTSWGKTIHFGINHKYKIMKPQVTNGEQWNENVETCSGCGIHWKKIGKSCPVCFSAPEEKEQLKEYPTTTTSFCLACNQEIKNCKCPERKVDGSWVGEQTKERSWEDKFNKIYLSLFFGDNPLQHLKIKQFISDTLQAQEQEAYQEGRNKAYETIKDIIKLETEASVKIYKQKIVEWAKGNGVCKYDDTQEWIEVESLTNFINKL